MPTCLPGKSGFLGSGPGVRAARIEPAESLAAYPESPPNCRRLELNGNNMALVSPRLLECPSIRPYPARFLRPDDDVAAALPSVSQGPPSHGSGA